jgi:stearoyl-CoA desaturase (delta-9 desaturase)
MKPLVRGTETDLVEIPANWYLDDLPPMMFIKKAPNSHGFVSPRHLEEMWRDQFDWVYREYDYAVFTMTVHPDVSGRPQVLMMHERLFIDRSWQLQQLPWAVLFFAAGGMPWLVCGIAVRVAVSVTGHWLVGYFAHNRGPRSWHINGAGVQGYNIPGCGLITMGEAWHNNHHAFPGSARLGIKEGEWDPGWWVLMVLYHVGLRVGCEYA